MKKENKIHEKKGLPIIAAAVTAFLLLAGLLLLIPRPSKPMDNLTVPPSISQSDCIVGGCSGELCVDKKGGDIASPCIWSEAFACVKYSTCARQQDGKCGWTETKEYQSCLEKAKVNPFQLNK